VKNAAAFEIYRTRAAASIAQYGGQYLVHGGSIERLEGGWAPRTIIVVEFPDVEWASTWYRSPEYAEALAVRDEALGRNLILVDGISATRGSAAAQCRHCCQRCGGARFPRESLVGLWDRTLYRSSVLSNSDGYASFDIGIAASKIPAPGPSGCRQPDGPRSVCRSLPWSQINDAKSETRRSNATDRYV
jgi:uncharacterized protein (DUF1330 family)